MPKNTVYVENVFRCWKETDSEGRVLIHWECGDDGAWFREEQFHIHWLPGIVKALESLKNA